MKAEPLNTFTKSTSAAVIILLPTLLLQSCSRKVSFQTSQEVVPAAEGSVKITKDNNNNYKIDLKLVRLADPKKLSLSKEIYVVWNKTEQKTSAD